MFYIYTLLIPLLIIFFFIKFFNKKDIINSLLIISIILWFYLFLIYFLGQKNIIEDNWISFSIFFFLFPISIILLIIKVLIYFKKNK